MIVPSRREYWTAGAIVTVIVAAMIGFIVLLGLAIRSALATPETAGECMAKLLPSAPGQPIDCEDWSSAVNRCRELESTK